MNAPAAPVAVTERFQLLPLASITPSATNPRKHFDKARLDELAESIRKVDVLQPILVRTLSDVSKGIRYEIVAGERRYRAAKLAKKEQIPAIVRDLADVEVLEIQVIENLQRDDLQPLEEADGYDQLIKLHHKQGDSHMAEQIAAKIGKSRSYVFGRMQLLKLCPEARKALQEGKLDVSRAQLIARIPVPDIQTQALQAILEGNDNYYKDDDEPLSYRAARDLIQEEYMLALKDAPFDAKDAALVPAAGACTTCPKRTGNQPDLFGDIKSRDICTDPKCFASKKQALAQLALKTAEDAGKKVIKGNDAAGIVKQNPYDADRYVIGGGYQELDSFCHDDPKHRKVREVIGKSAGIVEVVAVPATGELVEVVKTSALKELLNDKGVKTTGQKRAQQAQKTRQENAQAEIEEKINQLTLRQVIEKHSGKLDRAELLLIAEEMADYMVDGYSGPLVQERVAAAMTWARGDVANDAGRKLKTLQADSLCRFMLALAIATADSTPELRALAKKHKVNVDAIRKSVMNPPADKPAAKPAKKKPGK